MTRDHVKIVVDRGDVMVQQTNPNERIDTGHHCSKLADAQNIVGTAQMIPETTELDPTGISYDEISQNAFAGQTVEHSLNVELNIRYRRCLNNPFGHGCRLCWQDENCPANAQSKGKNHFFINLQANNVMTKCISGVEHLSFNIDTTLMNEKLEEEYSPIAHNVGKCAFEIFGI